jgi:hypothetical protein
MRLNMWHRLGVALSVTWLVGASALVLAPPYINSSQAADAAERACLSDQTQAKALLREAAGSLTGGRGHLTPAEFEELKRLTAQARAIGTKQLSRDCSSEGTEAREQLMRGTGVEWLKKVLLPVLSAWLLAYLVLWIGRWVLAGRRT